jgi:hypothetical protein
MCGKLYEMQKKLLGIAVITGFMEEEATLKTLNR